MQRIELTKEQKKEIREGYLENMFTIFQTIEKLGGNELYIARTEGRCEQLLSLFGSVIRSTSEQEIADMAHWGLTELMPDDDNEEMYNKVFKFLTERILW